MSFSHNGGRDENQDASAVFEGDANGQLLLVISDGLGVKFQQVVSGLRSSTGRGKATDALVRTVPVVVVVPTLEHGGPFA